MCNIYFSTHTHVYAYCNTRSGKPHGSKVQNVMLISSDHNRTMGIVGILILVISDFMNHLSISIWDFILFSKFLHCRSWLYQGTRVAFTVPYQHHLSSDVTILRNDQISTCLLIVLNEGIFPSYMNLAQFMHASLWIYFLRETKYA